MCHAGHTVRTFNPLPLPPLRPKIVYIKVITLTKELLLQTASQVSSVADGPLDYIRTHRGLARFGSELYDTIYKERGLNLTLIKHYPVASNA